MQSVWIIYTEHSCVMVVLSTEDSTTITQLYSVVLFTKDSSAELVTSTKYSRFKRLLSTNYVCYCSIFHILYKLSKFLYNQTSAIVNKCVKWTPLIMEFVSYADSTNSFHFGHWQGYNVVNTLHTFDKISKKS